MCPGHDTASTRGHVTHSRILRKPINAKKEPVGRLALGLPFFLTKANAMPILNIVVPASIESALRETARSRATSIDSLVGVALGEYLKSDRHRMYQISTSGALVEGVYSGTVLSRSLLEHGDFGLGTFENLDGEMVIVDGAIYQVRCDGTVLHRQDEFPIPFAVITRLEDQAVFETGKIGCLKDLELACDPHRESENLFYAFRVDGAFDNVHARAVSGVVAGTRLMDAAKKQGEFSYTGIEGTLVCFWSPSYSSSFNVPGYHFHFISKDRTRGGHVLDCSAGPLRIGVQMLTEYDVRLPDTGMFLTADLSRNPTSDLAKTE
jgi:acetolactate decarboxylase